MTPASNNRPPDWYHRSYDGSRLQAVQDRIRAAARSAGRDPRDVQLIAVSKTFDAEVIRAAHAAGQRHFGESYLQEALAKMDAAVAAAAKPISDKRGTAEYRTKIATVLARRAAMIAKDRAGA